MSTLVLLPNAGVAPASPTLGPWVGFIFGLPGSVRGQAVPMGLVAGSVTSASAICRAKWSTVMSDWEVKA